MYLLINLEPHDRPGAKSVWNKIVPVVGSQRPRRAEERDATPFVLRPLRKAAVRCMRASFPAARLPPAPAAQ